jgi:hypothetical protein
MGGGVSKIVRGVESAEGRRGGGRRLLLRRLSALKKEAINVQKYSMCQ